MYRNIEDFINDWEVESDGTFKIFSATTDSSRKEKFHPEVRTLDRLAWHLIQTITEMGNKAGLFTEDELEHANAPSTTAELAETYQKYSNLLAKAVRSQWTDSSLQDKTEMYGEQWEKGKTLRVLIAHQTHHRGQMTVIMRLSGLRVPGIYGPSKEEWAEFGMLAPE